MININWQREMARIYVMGRIDPVTFGNNRRQTITIDVTDEDGQGQIVMTDEMQLYRLYEKLREFYHPQTVQVNDTGAADARERIEAIQTARREEPLWARTYVTPFPTDLPMEYVPAQPREGQVFTREMLEEAQQAIENTTFEPERIVMGEQQYQEIRETLNENYGRTDLRRAAYIPPTYTDLNYGPTQTRRRRMPPQEIQVDITIAEDPADQESILEFMEKE